MCAGYKRGVQGEVQDNANVQDRVNGISSPLVKEDGEVTETKAAAKKYYSGSKDGDEVFKSIYGERIEDEDYIAIRVRIKSLEDSMRECNMGLHTAMSHGKGK